jgi:hypothetical protein
MAKHPQFWQPGTEPKPRGTDLSPKPKTQRNINGGLLKKRVALKKPTTSRKPRKTK